jgi:hypothetical protein
MKRIFVSRTLCILFLLMSIRAWVWAADLYVSPSGSGTACTQTTPCAFQQALDIASSNGEDDTIHVLPGTYYPSSTLTYTPASTENFALNIMGDSQSTSILDGQSSIQIMNFYSGGLPDDSNVTFNLQNLTFQNGSNPDPSGTGGGIYIATKDGGVILQDIHFTSNTADFGGGAYITSSSTGSVNVNNCTFVSNGSNTRTRNGGGLSIHTDTGPVSVLNSIFTGNQISPSGTTAGGGAKVSSNLGSIEVGNCVFSNNFAVWGGGLLVDSMLGDTVVYNNIFYDNSANEGGGAYAANEVGGNVRFTNNTFYNNQSSVTGGGMTASYLADNSYLDCYNNIFWNNSSKYGSDIYVETDIDDNNVAATVNCFNNDLSDISVTDPNNFNQGNNINADPLFADAANGDFHLTATSPCIDAGDNNAPSLPGTDFEDDPRIINGTVDMGADEYETQQTGPTAVPTMNERGMIIFIILAGLSGLSYMRKRKGI